ncbi:MAG: peptide-methionine (R)-S-oxide reductase MsrB [Candidatus Pacebacteria bacterium]|nr:peptide-methionine (R)-S-oxide reductase MsrB [Candidatus Paceibacterota bacterium]MCF7857250.1 peptide-methionine (R)-S-oxide reductase MsrB [Candidatus Paceibacterota bacterium]
MHVYKKIFLISTLILLLGFCYYIFSPLFIKISINDVLPVERTTSSTDTAIIPDVTRYPITGTSGHPAQGTVQLITTDTERVIRYEDFKTINGPDLFVYLSKDIDGKEFINLGEIKGTEGNINYLIPSDVDLATYHYVLTWCKQFGVLFNYADIMSNSSSTEITQTTSTDNTSTQTSSEVSPSITVPPAAPVIKKTALLANGCFWCVENDLKKVTGVIDVISGYAGGNTESPTYKNYTEGGHREVVLVTYNASEITFANLVEHIIKHGDPTDSQGSFNDRGEEYAPAIYYENSTEKAEAERVIQAIDMLGIFNNPLPLPVLPRAIFWPAEDYHQDYATKNPIRYTYYRSASGRDSFIKKYWSGSENTFVVPKLEVESGAILPSDVISKEESWTQFLKPSNDILQSLLTPLQYKVTQKDGTESPYTNIYDKLYDDGVYVDIVSGEPLYLSKDKYDSGTGWPSFVKPISLEAVTLKEDNGLFSKRTEVRSKYADSHLGHVFDDGPADRGGKRYCMNSAALRFIPRDMMEQEGYAYIFPLMDTE